MVMLYFAEGRSMVVGHYDIAKSCFVSVCLPFQLLTLLEKYPNTEFFLVRIFPHSDGIRTRKNSVFGHFSRSVCYVQCISNDLQVLVILLYHLYNGGTYLKIKFRIQSLSKSVFI